MRPSKVEKWAIESYLLAFFVVRFLLYSMKKEDYASNVSDQPFQAAVITFSTTT
jgi:hypothetical protein